MPTFKFTSPDGQEYYGEGANESEAFGNAKPMSAGEVAAMRTRQAARPSGGRGESEFTEMLENSLVPGLGAVKGLAGAGGAALEGDSETAGKQLTRAGKEAATSAAGWLGGPIMSRIPTALKAGGAMAAGLFSPTATAGETKFPFISDPEERAAADKRWENIKVYQTDPKTGRQTLDRTATSKARDEFFGTEQKAQKDRIENLAEQKDFDARVAPALEKLSPEEREIYDSITVPGNPGQTRANKAEYLRSAEEARRQFNMTWAEKHPTEMEELQGAAFGLSVLGPVYQSWRRALGLNRTAKDAELAFQKAIKARAPKSAQEELQWRTNLAEELDKVNDPGFIRAVAKSALIGGVVSSAATQGPNFVDWARLPPGEARDKARAAALDPEAYGRSMLEGGLGGAAGRGLTEKFGMLPAAKARNAAIVGTARKREAEAAEKLQAAKLTREKNAAAKAAREERMFNQSTERMRLEQEAKEKAALARALRPGGSTRGEAGGALSPQGPLAPSPLSANLNRAPEEQQFMEEYDALVRAQGAQENRAGFKVVPPE